MVVRFLAGVEFFSFPKQSELEVDHFPPSDARVKNVRSLTFLWHAQGKIYVCRSKIRNVLVLRPLICLGYQARVISECERW
jgi:hypothetical protein